MIYSNDLIRIAEEFDLYYSNFNPDSERLLKIVNQMYEIHKIDSSYILKTELHELMCRECKVHLFKESPFFFEISSGRTRYTWGGLQSPVGSFLHNTTADKWLDPYADSLASDMAEGLIRCWNNPVGFDHHCPGYD
ncbi:MAG: hypothetical protein ACOYJ1_13265, partial [Peptococcales bacterium]